ncbi:unannotated protein [freshwater metagenome]|uniref:Unannotated protein n=1 Tax=freshwater metagenome TaxID=449393 RepID=A0A6J7QX89_9ZZZZ
MKAGATAVSTASQQRTKERFAQPGEFSLRNALAPRTLWQNSPVGG